MKFKDFLNSLIVESLHPELQDVVKNKASSTSKQTLIAKKIKDLTARGEKTGIEGNMPKGSSRAYLKHDEPAKVIIDGKSTSMKIGTKVAIRSSLDKFHNKAEHNGMSLGEMQNHVENGDYHVNNHHRTLSQDEHGHYHSNEDGIFPPLIDHDYDKAVHSTVGHCDKITKSKFKELTKCESHPNGISHDDFCNSLERFHNRNNGKHWSTSNDSHLDHVDEHPLVQKFTDYHGNFAASPDDYRQLGNLGVWKHPHTGQEHIVARDHGYGGEVPEAYRNARMKSRG